MKSGAKVIYIDDDPDHRHLMKFYLGRERNDKVILCAPDFQEIRIAVEQNVPELIILSVASLIEHSPQGIFDFCRQLKAIPVLQNVPVLLWSVYNPHGINAEAQRAGISGYTVYPHNLQALIAARDTLLEGDVYYPFQESA